MSVLVALVIGAAPAVGQTATPPQAEMRGSGTYAHLFTLEFRPGKTDEGLSVLRSHLVPAWRAVGLDVTVIESLVGTKDVMLIIPLLEGPRYFEAVLPSQDAAAWAALIEKHGEEAAERAVDKFVSLLQRQSSDFVFLPDWTEAP